MLLKSFDLPKYKVEPVVHKLEIEPHKPHKTSKEKHGDNNGYKVINLFVGGINMASVQHSDVVSVIQRNSGQMQALLVAMRD